MLDLVVSGLVVFFAVVGAVAGALAQGLQLAMVFLCGLLGRPLGAFLGPALRDALGMPALLATLAGTTLGFFGLYLALRLISRAIVARFTRDHEVRAADRGLGAFFGAGKAILVSWVLLSGLVHLEAPLARIGWRFDAKGSFFGGVAREHNFFSSFSLPLAPRLPAP